MPAGRALAASTNLDSAGRSARGGRAASPVQRASAQRGQARQCVGPATLFGVQVARMHATRMPHACASRPALRRLEETRGD
jgi:hypothetical protein